MIQVSHQSIIGLRVFSLRCIFEGASNDPQRHPTRVIICIAGMLHLYILYNQWLCTNHSDCEMFETIAMMSKQHDHFYFDSLSFSALYCRPLIDVNYCVQLIIGIISHSVANANHTICSQFVLTRMEWSVKRKNQLSIIYIIFFRTCSYSTKKCRRFEIFFSVPCVNRCVENESPVHLISFAPRFCNNKHKIPSAIDPLCCFYRIFAIRHVQNKFNLRSILSGRVRARTTLPRSIIRRNQFDTQTFVVQANTHTFILPYSLCYWFHIGAESAESWNQHAPHLMGWTFDSVCLFISLSPSAAHLKCI